MASRMIFDALPHHLAWAIRKADVLTGEFLRPISADAMAELATMGLASAADGTLTRRGMELRSWLMRGTEHAPREVFRLLQVAAGSCVMARFVEAAGGPNSYRGSISAATS